MGHRAESICITQSQFITVLPLQKAFKQPSIEVSPLGDLTYIMQVKEIYESEVTVEITKNLKPHFSQSSPFKK
jgi:hypothetical protein